MTEKFQAPEGGPQAAPTGLVDCGECFSGCPAGKCRKAAPEHIPASAEHQAKIDEAVGIVQLPPIRVSTELHAALTAEAAGRGLIVQALVREKLEAPAPAEGDSELPRMLREIGYWDHRGDEVSEACDERYGAGSWAAILAMMESKAQPKGTSHEAKLALQAANGDTITCYGTALDMMTLARAWSMVVQSKAPAPAQEPLSEQQVDELSAQWEEVGSRLKRKIDDGTYRTYVQFSLTRLRHFTNAARGAKGQP